MAKSLEQKKTELALRIQKLGSVLVAFSGGVDSTLVLAVARQVLGDRVLAVTAESESVPQRELQEARRLAEGIGVRHRTIGTREMESPNYRRNPADRCYYCKTELYGKLAAVAEKEGLAAIANGVNADDLGDHRPGLQAGKEAGVVSPLADTGLTKSEIRQLSQDLGLPTWEKPAMPCLASRIPYGQSITPEKLDRIEQAEAYLFSLGFRELRVRHHDNLARIELAREEMARFLQADLREAVQKHFQALGFQYVTLDVAGFRSGRMNEVLDTDGKPDAYVEH